jgi:hypothetical protein
MKNRTKDSSNDTTTREVRVGSLLGRQVLASNNQPVGHLEEIRVEKHGARLVVTAYVIGVAGLIERLNVTVKLLFGKRGGGGYLARWDQLDISEPMRPRLKCPLNELERQ